MILKANLLSDEATERTTRSSEVSGNPFWTADINESGPDVLRPRTSETGSALVTTADLPICLA